MKNYVSSIASQGLSGHVLTASGALPDVPWAILEHLGSVFVYHGGLVEAPLERLGRCRRPSWMRNANIIEKPLFLLLLGLVRRRLDSVRGTLLRLLNGARWISSAMLEVPWTPLECLGRSGKLSWALWAAPGLRTKGRGDFQKGRAPPGAGSGHRFNYIRKKTINIYNDIERSKFKSPPPGIHSKHHL